MQAFLFGVWVEGGQVQVVHWLLTSCTSQATPSPPTQGSAQNGSWRQGGVTTQPLGTLRASTGPEQGIMSPVSAQCLWDAGGSLAALPELGLA